MGINTFIIEEHHEAFIVWAYAIKNNMLHQNSCLLHFDDHADFRIPIFNSSIHDIFNKPMYEIEAFVYEEMKIDTFIAPAIYLGLFDEFIWIQNGMQNSKSNDLYIRSYNGAGKKLIMTREKVAFDDLIPFKFRKLSFSEFNKFRPDSSKAAVLDIDLDYFSCCEMPSLSNTMVIEITENEYNSFVNNRYHSFNFWSGLISPVQENGSYFYVINGYKEKYVNDREVSTEVIDGRINEFITRITEINLLPDLITICRSRYSGFTPEHQWEMIEDKLLNRLADLYEIDVKQISQLAH